MHPPRKDPLLPDYYAELGVPPGSSPAIIRASFRSQVRALNSDPNAVSADRVRIALASRAYDVLSDPHRRLAYDLLRQTSYSSFILLITDPRAHFTLSPASLLLVSLLVLLVVALLVLRWDIAMYVLGSSAAVLAILRLLLDWLVPAPHLGALARH